MLHGDGKKGDPADRGLGDRGDNYLSVAERIVNDLSNLTNWRRISRAVKAVNRAATGLTLAVPEAGNIDVNFTVNGTALHFDVRQESEGFRRLWPFTSIDVRGAPPAACGAMTAAWWWNRESFQELFGNSDGPGVPAKSAPTVARRNSNADRPCCAQVATAVQIRSDQRWPVSPRVPCVTTRSRTTNRIACSAKLFVGSSPGVVMNRR